MLSAIAIVPSAPVMVPELTGSAGDETAELRNAALTAVAALPPRWIGIGVGPCDRVDGPDAAGTFAGYGVDVPVALSEPMLRAGAAAPLPLSALIAGWLRGQAQPAAVAEVRTYRTDHSCEVAVGFGRALRAELDTTDTPCGVLLVADGANTLTPTAPGGHDPHSVTVQAALDDALSTGHPAALTALPDSIVGRVAYQVLAGLADPVPGSSAELYRGAPYGVGYFVGVWKP